MNENIIKINLLILQFLKLSIHKFFMGFMILLLSFVQSFAQPLELNFQYSLVVFLIASRTDVLDNQATGLSVPANFVLEKGTNADIHKYELIIPNGFSPNGDGIHDYFKIKHISKYGDAKIEILNRWGNLVYQKEKYGNVEFWGEDEAWWDGKANNSLNESLHELPIGTYFYILKLKRGKEAPITGSVFINR